MTGLPWSDRTQQSVDRFAELELRAHCAAAMPPAYDQRLRRAEHWAVNAREGAAAVQRRRSKSRHVRMSGWVLDPLTAAPCRWTLCSARSRCAEADLG